METWQRPGLVNARRSPLSLLHILDRTRRLRDVDGIRGRKGVLQALLQRPLEPASASLLLVILALFVTSMLGECFVRNSHKSSPCQRLMAPRRTTPGLQPVFLLPGPDIGSC